MEKQKLSIHLSQDRRRKLRETGGKKEEEEMTVCLQDCLRAVGLQHHYDRFTSVGVCRAVHLSALTMEDFPILGIRSMEDRTRLFSLIQMVKNLDPESLEHDDGYYADEVDRRNFIGDEEIYDDEEENGVDMMKVERSSSVRRRLDFSSKDPDHHQKLFYHPIYDDQHKATDVQPDGNTERACVCGCKENNSHSQDEHFQQSDHHTGATSEPDITRRTSMFYSHVRSSPQSVSVHKPKPRPAAVSWQRISNKQAALKESKGISRKETRSHTTSGHMCKQTPVYESKRTAGYNYGLPLSSPAAHKRRAGGQRISVCVRKRPQTHRECRRGEADVVTTPNDECVIVHESKESVDLTQYILQHRFYFDQVFGEESSNEDVYLRTTYPLVQHVLNGGKATCFAYGQTGAGKTHTMLGSSPRRPGLYALAVRDIFTHLSNTNMHSLLQVYVSFFEIYCGQLYDLLDHRKRLFAREDGQKVVHIAGLRDIRMDSVSSLLKIGSLNRDRKGWEETVGDDMQQRDEVQTQGHCDEDYSLCMWCKQHNRAPKPSNLKVIAQGTEERTQGASGVNPLSSRSHALLQIQLRGPNQQVTGRMWFVDLAGSERASDTREPDRQSRMEGAEINQSLLALKECIRSLDQEQSHTPFRQSKLTQVLKDSFIGDSMTCMIANISPGHLATEHTLNTLRYADRVKELKGQGGLRGGRRGKTSPKRNLSKSSSSGNNRGKSPPKKPKLGRQREPPLPATPTTRLAPGGPIFCSTPKSSRHREDTRARERKEQITAVRDLLGRGDGRKTAGGKEARTRERFEESDSAVYSLADHIRECRVDQRENQQSTLKGGIEGEEKERRQKQSSGDSSGERDEEKYMHLKRYHQQLQQFVPSAASSSLHLFSPSSNPASLSPSASPSSCSSLRHSSRLSASALSRQGLKDVLDSYGARADRSRGLPSSVPTGDASESCGSEDEVCDEDSSGRVRREVWRPAGMEGVGGRRWAWEAELTGGTTGVRPAAVQAQVSYNCDSEERRAAGEDFSDVPTDGSRGNEEHESNDSLFTHPAVESSHHRAPAERPLSPSCEHTDTLRKSNKLSEASVRSYRTKATLNNPLLPSQKSTMGLSQRSFREKKHLSSPDADTRQFSSPPSDALSLTDSEAIKSGVILPEDSFSPFMDPLSISLLQVDQQAATSSFLQGEPRTSSLYWPDSGRDDRRKGEKKQHMACLDVANKNEEEEFCLSRLVVTQGRTQSPSMSNLVTTITTEEGIMKLHVPDAVLNSLRDQEINQRPQTSPTIEVLSIQDLLKPSTAAASVTQSLSSSVQPSRIYRTPIPHNLKINGAAQMQPECAHKMHDKLPLSNSTTPSERVSGWINTSPKQCHTVQSSTSSNSNISQRSNERTESNVQGSTGNNKTGNMINLPEIEDLNIAQWRVVQAHWEQLEEMEALFHKEGNLLSQQPDMAFSEYVHKLEEIMERKARCVKSMMAELQPYLQLSPSHSAHNCNQRENHYDQNT